MGLDMYLEKCNRKAYGFKDVDIDKIKESKPDLYNEIKPYFHERGKYIHWTSIFEEVGYWRKANAIHKWFVDNVQNEVDDCGRYEVSEEKLRELLNICIKVRDGSKLVKGWIQNGTMSKDGRMLPCVEEGEYIEDPSVAEELLPTQRGFFFGGTDYDEWYMEDIKNTIEILTEVLETTDFDREMITYHSSW